MEKLVKTYGTYHKPVNFRRYSEDHTVDTKVFFYDLEGDKAKVEVRFWNGRTWNCIESATFTKAEANELARQIIHTNEINKRDFV